MKEENDVSRRINDVSRRKNYFNIITRLQNSCLITLKKTEAATGSAETVSRGIL